MEKIWNEKKETTIEELTKEIIDNLVQSYENENKLEIEHQFDKWTQINLDPKSAHFEMDSIRRKKKEEDFSLMNKIALYYLDLDIKDDGSWEENESNFLFFVYLFK